MPRQSRRRAVSWESSGRAGTFGRAGTSASPITRSRPSPGRATPGESYDTGTSGSAARGTCSDLSPPCLHLAAPRGGRVCAEVGLAEFYPPRPAEPLLLLSLLHPRPILPRGEAARDLHATGLCVWSPLWTLSVLASRARPPALLLFLLVSPWGRPGSVPSSSARISAAPGAFGGILRCLPFNPASISSAPGACGGILRSLPDLHLSVQRLGDAVELVVVHVGKGPLHGMTRHSLPAPRGRFGWVATHVDPRPGTNSWACSTHRLVSLLREQKTLPGRVSRALTTHALRPGRAYVPWESGPVSTGTLLTLGLFGTGGPPLLWLQSHLLPLSHAGHDPCFLALQEWAVGHPLLLWMPHWLSASG